MGQGKRPKAGTARQSWRTAPAPTLDHLPGTEWLTHVGSPKFHDMPRFRRELDISTCVGKLRVGDAVRASFGRPATRKDRVRYFQCALLQAADYWCLATPTGRNPSHSSIFAPLQSADCQAHEAWWTDPNRVRLRDIAQEVTQE